MRSSRSLSKAIRTYRYDLSIHGALFLSSTPEDRRAIITSYRDPNFLRAFYARLRRNESPDHRDLREQGYEWVSHCQGEENFLRPALDGSAIVFDDLVDGELKYGAGSLSSRFSPSDLRVSPRTGYLFHPSPQTSRNPVSPYGPYSLLRSALVLDHFADTLELDANGGTFKHEGQKYAIATLDERSDVWWRHDQKL
ncbi:hypothetical protein JCM3766R1_001655 [Sporobolomyces carnicolor]